MNVEPSLVGLLIQTAGVILVAILSLLVNRAARRLCLLYWTACWAALAFGLACLLVGNAFPMLAPATQPLYLLGSLGFGYMLLAGCRQYATGAVLGPRHGWLLAPALAYALTLPAAAGHDLNRLLAPQSAILFGLFLASFLVLRRLPGPAGGEGLTVMRVALLLLAAVTAHYVPAFAARALGWLPPLDYLDYSPLYDVLLQAALGFGAVLLVMESVRQDLESAHREASQARDRLEVQARLDPLTESLNRHAFYSLLKSGDRVDSTSLRGCAVAVDLDDLKVVNDRFGHATGDLAIRTVAKAIRTFIRADDLLFRWGGDEFLALMIGADEAEVRRRFNQLNDQLAQMPVPRTQHTVTASFGIATFGDDQPLNEAIERADAAMYEQKRVKLDAQAAAVR